jgi:hypothetical protein
LINVRQPAVLELSRTRFLKDTITCHAKNFKAENFNYCVAFRQDCKLARWQGMLKFDVSYSNGDSGGKLWVFWKDEVQVNIL